MSDILKKILARKVEEVAVRSAELSMAELASRCQSMPPARGFAMSLDARVRTGMPAVIAEIKRASPSAGVIRADFDPEALAKSYAGGGATCLSILTDTDFFRGSDTHLKLARSACSLPVLRKDFLVDPWQVYESRAMGADCVLLIVAALSDARLFELAESANELGMDVLVEVHDEAELERALSLPARLIGVNNRSLRDFVTDVGTTLELAARVPGDRLLVSESGIRSRLDVARLRAAGVRAFLVGEAFMRADDPGSELSRLFRESSQ